MRGFAVVYAAIFAVLSALVGLLGYAHGMSGAVIAERVAWILATLAVGLAAVAMIDVKRMSTRPSNVERWQTIGGGVFIASVLLAACCFLIGCGPAPEPAPAPRGCDPQCATMPSWPICDGCGRDAGGGR